MLAQFNQYMVSPFDLFFIGIYAIGTVLVIWVLVKAGIDIIKPSKNTKR